MIKQLTAIPFPSLIESLKDSSYSFAMWKLPNQADSQLIVSLNGISQEIETISDFSSGFLMNSFKENHPINPVYIPADIVFSNSEVHLSPNTSAKDVDEFVQFINEKNEALSLKEQNETTINENQQNSESFNDIVTKAIGEIRNGSLEKIVLSRFEDIKLPEDFSLLDFYNKVCHNYHGAFCSLVHMTGLGVWIGASPELLVSQNSNEFRTISLAGTKKLDTNVQLNEIAWTQKEIEEQAFVSRYVINCFKKLRLREFAEHGPKTVKAGNLAHLKTDYKVTLNEVGIENLVDQMLELLHPTSAVCGMPLDASKEFIDENENFDREFFAGFLGPVNFENSTDLFVNLRCMKIDDNWGRLYAGAGITEDSVPEKEFNETELKIATLKSLIN